MHNFNYLFYSVNTDDSGDLRPVGCPHEGILL